MLEEAFGKAKNLLASAMYYPYRMIVASSVWVLPRLILLVGETSPIPFDQCFALAFTYSL